MKILLLLLLAFQDKPADEGLAGMRALLKDRAANSEKIFALKKAGKEAQAEKAVTFKATPAASLDRVLAEKLDLPFFVDLGLRADDLAKSVTIDMTAPAWKILDEACRQAGLDWGFFHGHYVLSTADRLWPEIPTKTIALTPEQEKSARAMVEKLNSESLEERDASQESLRKLGKGVLAILQEGAGRAEAEIASRCKTLVQAFTKPLGMGHFGPAAVDAQKLAGDDAEVVTKLKEGVFTIKVRDIPMEAFYKITLAQKGLSADLGPTVKGIRFTVDYCNINAMEMIKLVSQSLNCDLMVRDAKLVIDTKEAIAGKLADKK